MDCNFYQLLENLVVVFLYNGNGAVIRVKVSNQEFESA